MSFKFKFSFKIISLWILLVIFLNCFLIADLFAQNPDTLEVINAYGQPNDTVSVFINMVNADTVVGFVIQLSFYPGILEVVDVNTTPRSYFFENYNFIDSIHTDYVRVVAYVTPPFNDYILPGSGNVLEVRFLIDANAPNGEMPVEFYNLVEGDNAWSDNHFQMVFPELIDGFVGVSGGTNNLPVIDIYPGSPQDIYYAYEGVQMQPLTVSASDIDGDSITLSAEDLPAGASFPQVVGDSSVQSTFSYTPPEGSAPDTFFVTFIADDGSFFPATRTITIYLLTGEVNQPPVIVSVPPQTVNEGDHLEFDVTAFDPDGDVVTLEASNIPPNGQFSTVQGDSIVTGTFTFDPDFNQGPDTIYVRFTARDDHNHVTHLNVQIIIFDVANDFLVVQPNQGALPGAVGRQLIVNLINAKPIYGLQFDFIYDPQVLDISQVVPSERAEGLAFFDTLFYEGCYRIMIFSFGGETIESGSGEIVRFEVDVYLNALPGPTPVTFDSATSVQDSLGSSKDIIYNTGVFTVDILGDANLDGIVSVGDCVAVVANLLGRIEFDIRAADAADYNRDGEVRIADLMEIVNHILGRSPLLSPPPGLAGSVELLREGLYSGVRTGLPLWLSLDEEGSAIQFTIDYDPSQIKVHSLTQGDMVSELVFDYQDTGKKILGIIYDLDLSVFGPGVGELIIIDVEVIGDTPDPGRALRLTDFEIVNKDAQALNIQVLGELPTNFTLYQNYPNPFNAYTTVSFDMPYSSYARVTVYNILGQVVAQLFDDYLEAGNHHLIWDGTDSRGNYVTSGVYFYRLQADNFDQTRKMLLVK